MHEDGQEILSAFLDSSDLKLPLNGTLVVGQEQDSLGGNFAAGESLRGKMALLNIWDRVVEFDEIINMSNCKTHQKGNLFNLDDEQIRLYNVREDQISQSDLCSSEDDFFLLDGFDTLEETRKVCNGLGSSLYVPETKEAIENLFRVITNSTSICKFLTSVFVGISDEAEEGVWRKYSDGNIVTETHFLSSEQKDDRDKNCAIMSRKVASFTQHNCSAVWPVCAPCVPQYDAPVRLRGLCFESEQESFMLLKGYVNGSIYLQGYYGMLVHRIADTKEWQLFDSSSQKIIAIVHLSLTEEYPVGRREWILQSDICNFAKGSVVQLSLSSCNTTEFSCDNAECIPRHKLCNGISDCSDFSDETNCKVFFVPEGYKLIRPPETKFTESGPIFVSFSVNVLRFIEVNDVRNLVVLELDIEMRWRDRRLFFYNLANQMENNKLAKSDISQIWNPSLVFPSVYNGKINPINEQMNVMKNGSRKPDDFNSVYTGKEQTLTQYFLDMHMGRSVAHKAPSPS